MRLIKQHCDGSEPTYQPFRFSYQLLTYRSGIFSGRSGPRNFNEGSCYSLLSLEYSNNFQDLAAPLLQQLSNQWENTFTKKIPDALVAHIKTCQRHQDHTHSLVKNQIREKFAFNGITNVLQDQEYVPFYIVSSHNHPLPQIPYTLISPSNYFSHMLRLHF